MSLRIAFVGFHLRLFLSGTGVNLDTLSTFGAFSWTPVSSLS